MLEPATKPKPKYKGRKEIREKLMAESSMSYCVNQNALILDLYGPLAALPSLKNQKLPGLNSLGPRAVAFLQAMTRFFVPRGLNDSERLGRLSLHLGSCDSIFCLIRVTEKARSDTDGIASLVQEWLEPQFYLNRKGEKKNRGWGIGLIDDDKKVRSLCLKWTGDGTQIVICSFQDALVYGLGAFIQQIEKIGG